MILLVGTVAVSANAKTGEEWVEIFLYTDEKSPYVIHVNQSKIDNIVKYKLVVLKNNSTKKIEYITQPYILNGDEKYYDFDNEYYQYEILLKAVEKDEYLGLSFSKRLPIINNICGTHLCYDCYDSTLIVNVCSKCKNDTFTMKGKNYICTKCKKNNYTSLRKEVCSKCKGTNFESKNIIWNITAHWDIEDVHKACWTQNNSVAYVFAQSMLAENWVTMGDAYLLQPNWDDALKLSESSKETFSENEKIIRSAVWENQKIVANYFSGEQTDYLIEKYEALAKEKCIGAIIDSIVGVSGIFVSQEYFKYIDTIYTALEDAKEETDKLLEFKEDLSNAKSEEELETIFRKLGKEELNTLLKQIIEVSPMTSSIKEYLGTFGIDKMIKDGAEVISEAADIINLCNGIVDDFSDFYDKYYAILNGSNTKKRYIKNLYDDIVLATTIKNALN